MSNVKVSLKKEVTVTLEIDECHFHMICEALQFKALHRRGQPHYSNLEQKLRRLLEVERKGL